MELEPSESGLYTIFERSTTEPSTFQGVYTHDKVEQAAAKLAFVRRCTDYYKNLNQPFADYVKEYYDIQPVVINYFTWIDQAFEHYQITHDLPPKGE